MHGLNSHTTRKLLTYYDAIWNEKKGFDTQARTMYYVLCTMCYVLRTKKELDKQTRTMYYVVCTKKGFDTQVRYASQKPKPKFTLPHTPNPNPNKSPTPAIRSNANTDANAHANANPILAAFPSQLSVLSRTSLRPAAPHCAFVVGIAEHPGDGAHTYPSQIVVRAVCEQRPDSNRQHCRIDTPLPPNPKPHPWQPC